MFSLFEARKLKGLIYILIGETAPRICLFIDTNADRRADKAAKQ